VSTAPSEKTGLLLVNLGTPDSPRPSDVRRYLREFLSDPRVIDLPAWGRWLLLNLIILPFRPRRSGKAYEKIWTDRGSPLLFHGRDLADKVQARLGDRALVELAMRYGEPSIDGALDRLVARGVSRVVAVPLYPHYSAAATGSTMEAVLSAVGRRWNVPAIQMVPPFHEHPAYVEALAAVARPELEAFRADRVVFSFHGLPERQLRKSDPGGAHCLERTDCCDALQEVNRFCYRAQCFDTARRLGDALGVPEEERVVCFQSRLGRTPWIRPYTDELLAGLPRQGVKRVAVLCPAFVADCLETLEEIGMRGLETFRASGGEDLRLVPALNASDAWADALVRIAREQAPWLAGAGDGGVAAGAAVGSPER
jgi:ferrochelatase